ncbi:MAG TPA: response regulator [Xanthobacteraceae bacterium]|nr:response regulator [Xanthobacteraceae bacterium]
MTPQSQLTAAPPVVVIVDDDPAVRNSLQFSLELEGYAVRSYRNAAELLNAGELGPCNCYVIDQRMPGMSGMELIGQLRARRISTPAILIISQPNDVLSARAAQADIAIVEKPLLNNALVERIREACQHA